MKAIKTYDTRHEAELASLPLRAEGIEAVVVGVGIPMQGGIAGVQLLVPDDQVQAALDILADS
jgi:hypothetical protein